jgi:DNA polymerase I-like protein with 3'-5' exonuclease and polymerase domains
MYNLWTDRDNRFQSASGRTKLRVEPLHQVHDEMVVQFRQEDTEWAKTKIKQWFNNPITIAGVWNKLHIKIKFCIKSLIICKRN